MSKILDAQTATRSKAEQDDIKTFLPSAEAKNRFDIAGYYFIGLFGLAIAGFWPSYFAAFFNGTGNFKFYIHFHAALMTLWIFILIAQPIIIRKKKLQLHRFIGKGSYILFPLLCVSIILLIHQTHKPGEQNPANVLLFQFRPFFILFMGYVIAIVYRHKVAIHARGMIVTGIALIDPSLTRLLLNLLGSFEELAKSPFFFIYASISSNLIIFSLLIGLMIKERRRKGGRWVFPLILGVYFILYVLVITDFHIGLWDSFAKWFIALPLT